MVFTAIYYVITPYIVCIVLAVRVATGSGVGTERGTAIYRLLASRPAAICRLDGSVLEPQLAHATSLQRGTA